MPRRPIVMQPLDNMQGIFRPKRVGSSTCPTPDKNPTVASYESDTGGFDSSLGLSPSELHAMQIGDQYPDLTADAADYLGL